MTTQYTGKLALVTGASRGFGYATAVELARRGAHVVAVARTTGGLEELADQIDKTDGASTLVPLDITDEPAIKRMCLALHDRWGHLDLFLHAAAHAVPLSPVDHTSLKDFDRAWEVNARATLTLITNLLPLLRAAPEPQAIFFRDPHTGPKFLTGFAASRSAQTQIAEAFAAETAQTGPKVTLFAPEPMPTALRHRFYPGENRDTLTPCATEATRLLDSL